MAAAGLVGVAVVVGQRAEERQRLVVQPAVAGERVAAQRPGAPVQRGEHAARLAHDHVDRGHVVQRQLRLGGQVDRPLGEQHVGPEVAEGPGAPAAPRERQEVVEAAALVPPRQRGVGQRRVVEAGHVGHAAGAGVEQRAARPRAAALGRPPAAVEPAGLTRTPPRPRRRSSARSGSPTPGRRARSSWSRRSGRPPSGGCRDRWCHPPRRRRRHGGGPGQRAPDASSTDRSASVTGVRSGLVTTCRSCALKRLVVSESASSASTQAVGCRCGWRAWPQVANGFRDARHVWCRCRRDAVRRPQTAVNLPRILEVVAAARLAGLPSGRHGDRWLAAAPARRARGGGPHPARGALGHRVCAWPRHRWLTRWPALALTVAAAEAAGYD